MFKKLFSSLKKTPEKGSTNPASEMSTERATPLKKSASINHKQKLKHTEQNAKSTASSEAQSRSEESHCAPVKWFDKEKKYGFLNTNDGDLFLHISELSNPSIIPEPGEIYTYELVAGADGRLLAKKASPVSKSNEAVIQKKDYSMLLNWAFVSGFNQNGRVYSELSQLALPEDWRYRESHSDSFDEYGVLRNYLMYIYTRLFNEKKIEEKNQFATFNTGLVDKLYRPIFATFERNNRETPPWRWKSFCVSGQDKEGKWLKRTFSSLPSAASFFTSLDDIYFDADANFESDIDHIALDGIRRDRYPHDFIEKYAGGFSPEDYIASPREYLGQVANRLHNNHELYNEFWSRVSNSIELARNRARWNYRAAVPQYYPPRDKMGFLLPLSLMDYTKVDAALVVEGIRVDDILSYQGHTIFPLSYAYRNARLVAKPISDWLDPAVILGS